MSRNAIKRHSPRTLTARGAEEHQDRGFPSRGRRPTAPRRNAAPQVACYTAATLLPRYLPFTGPCCCPELLLSRQRVCAVQVKRETAARGGREGMRVQTLWNLLEVVLPVTVASLRTLPTPMRTPSQTRALMSSSYSHTSQTCFSKFPYVFQGSQLL